MRRWRAAPQSVTYVLKNVADGTSAVVKVSGQAAGALSVGVGTVVEASATAAGVIRLQARCWPSSPMKSARR